MSKPTMGWRQAGIASFATTALVLGACVVGAGAASADESFAFERVSGHDRYDVSAATAKKFGSASSVILASGEEGKFGDALTASYLAGDRQVPVLLTQLNETPQVILDAIDSLGTNNITIVGGPLSVSSEQEAALEADGYNVDRVFGQTRYDTAAQVITTAGDRGNNTALIATGEKFPDALSAGPLAYAKGMPIGTVTLTDAPDAVIDALKAAGVTQAIVLGGNLSVGAEPRAELEAKGIDIIEEFEGRTRGAVSQQVAEYSLTQGLTNTRVNVASGRAFSEGADALGGGTLSGEQNRPILITDGEDVVGPFVLDYLSDHANTLTGTDNLLFGGLLSIGQDEENAMEAAARTVSPNQDFTVTPQEDVTLTLPAEEDATDNRRYVVNGLQDGTTYRVALIDAANVTEGANGAVSFADAETAGAGNGEADGLGSTPVAHISSANSSAEGDLGDAEDITPVNGSINFTIDGDQPGSVIPVLFLDADGDDQLDLDANNRPTEEFGVGGKTTYVATEQEGGAFDATVVSAVDKAADSFSLGSGTAARTVNYDANDSFRVDGVPTTFANFESELSTSDLVDGTYAPEPDAVSSFNLDNENPGTPTTTASAGEGANSNDVTVSVTIPTDSSSTDSVVIQRASVGSNGTVGSYTTIATVTPTAAQYAAGAVTHADNNLAAGTYRYRAALVNDGDQGAFDESPNVAVTAPPAPNETVRPTITDARRVTDLGLQGQIDQGETWRLTFSEDMQDDLATTGTFVLNDADGDRFTVTCAAEETEPNPATSACVLGNDDAGNVDRVLTIIVGTLADENTAGDDILEYPATIVTTDADVADQVGNVVNVGTSADAVIDAQ